MLRVFVGPARPATRLQPTIVRTSVATGNAAQVVGIAMGIALLGRAGATRRAALDRVTTMLGGWLAVYLSSHALAHWFVGRLGGIEFTGYRVCRGSANPEQYPPVMRSLMRHLPFWSAITARSSRSAGGPRRAAMFAAGETSSAITNLAVAVYVTRRRTPGFRIVAISLIIWTIMKTIATTRNERGDYAKALQALRDARM